MQDLYHQPYLVIQSDTTNTTGQKSADMANDPAVQVRKFMFQFSFPNSLGAGHTHEHAVQSSVKGT